jgi:hypothetical protein
VPPPRDGRWAWAKVARTNRTSKAEATVVKNDGVFMDIRGILELLNAEAAGPSSVFVIFFEGADRGLKFRGKLRGRKRPVPGAQDR